MEKQMAEEQQLALKLERQKEEEKLQQEKELKGILQQQMEELKIREDDVSTFDFVFHFHLYNVLNMVMIPSNHELN